MMMVASEATYGAPLCNFNTLASGSEIKAVSSLLTKLFDRSLTIGSYERPTKASLMRKVAVVHQNPGWNLKPMSFMMSAAHCYCPRTAERGRWLWWIMSGTAARCR